MYCFITINIIIIIISLVIHSILVMKFYLNFTWIPILNISIKGDF